MRSHLTSIGKKKVADFLLREEGMVGNRSAFATAAFVGTTSLAMFLLVQPDAFADCADGTDCPSGNRRYCCPDGPGNWKCVMYNGPGCHWAG